MKPDSQIAQWVVSNRYYPNGISHEHTQNVERERVSYSNKAMGLDVIHPEISNLPGLPKKFLHSFQGERSQEMINF